MRFVPVSMLVVGFTSAEMTFTLRSLSVLTMSVSRPGRSRVLTWTMLKEPVSSSGVTSTCVFIFSLRNGNIVYILQQASLLDIGKARTLVNARYTLPVLVKPMLFNRKAKQPPQ